MGTAPAEDGTLRIGAPPRWLRLLPVVLLAALILAQGVTPGDVELGAYYAAVAPLAALTYGVAGTGVMAVAVVVVMELPVVGSGTLVGAELGAVVLIGALSVVIAALQQRFRGRLVLARTVAEAAQLAVLAPVPGTVGRVRCAALYRAAQRGTLVGGDLYDVRPGPYGVRALVADVQGHGLAAVGTVAALLGAFREGVLDERELRGVAGRLERRLSLDAAGNAELFATALLLEFPDDGSRVRLVCQGHPPALLLRDREVRELECDPGPPLGAGLPGQAPALPSVVTLLPGDVILAYTDGVTEARDASGTFYPLAERLADRLAEGADLSPEAVVDAVWEDLRRYAGAVGDDVALLALAPR
ncbi:serine/threonine-protein phosphatase [Actinacidiphila glaucinigra]|uniref:PP2C family protein-serine/threonine phosphatase n=1 Tax=Actinacidiphila glaucinigra TaxID=235986 RepID=UPI002DDA3A46|nr:PP2C family protein-serine/threonine phosphatase [Actinacidiphila glaucinigra]WSD58807.1 serine/threonine-protein phosphatase [Actinacidiphila glaucinigra]